MTSFAVNGSAGHDVPVAAGDGSLDVTTPSEPSGGLGGSSHRPGPPSSRRTGLTSIPGAPSASGGS
jgi:hypothetical protein